MLTIIFFFDIEKVMFCIIISTFNYKCLVSVLFHFDADPDPAHEYFDADPDPAYEYFLSFAYYFLYQNKISKKYLNTEKKLTIRNI